MSEFSETFGLGLDHLIQVRVSAANDIGSSTHSIVNTIGARVRVKPSQMSEPTLGTDVTENQLEILWTALAGASTGNSDILGY